MKIEQRDLSDFIVNQLGLGPVWDIIQEVGNGAVQQIISEGLQLIVAGQEKFNKAKEVFNQLVSDLKDHGIQSIQTATQMVSQAINQVSQILSGNQKRDIADFLLNTLGLQDVWSEIQGLGANFVAQILNEAMQLVFAGQDILAQAQVIFSQLVSDLTNHAGNAATLVQNAINAVGQLLKSIFFLSIL